jgi:hypothetical protein
MPGRSYNANSYRYAYNGQHKSPEIYNSINHYTAEYWEYDSRVVMRWNPDPISFAWESPYSINRNNPIYFTDPDGALPILGKIGNLFRGGGIFGKKKYNVAKTGININFNWQGFGNMFRSVKLGPPLGRMVNQGWTHERQDEWFKGSLSTSGNAIQRTDAVNVFSEMASKAGTSRVTLTGIEAKGNATLGTSFRITGGLSQGQQRSLFASNGLQNMTLPSHLRMLLGDGDSPLPVNYFEARSGFLPGTNLIPTLSLLTDIFKQNSSNPNMWTLGSRSALFMWMGNGFNNKPITTNNVWSLRFTAFGAIHGRVDYEYRYKWSAWEQWGPNKPLHVQLWHNLIWGNTK